MNPIEKFNALPTKTKVVVGVGAVGLAGLLYYRSTQGSGDGSDTSDTTDSTGSQTGVADMNADTSDSFMNDEGIIPYATGASPAYGAAYGGGGLAYTLPATNDPTTTLAQDGTTPDYAALGQSIGSGLSDIANALQDSGAADGENPATLVTGGGAPSGKNTLDTHASPALIARVKKKQQAALHAKHVKEASAKAHHDTPQKKVPAAKAKTNKSTAKPKASGHTTTARKTVTKKPVPKKTTKRH